MHVCVCIVHVCTCMCVPVCGYVKIYTPKNLLVELVYTQWCIGKMRSSMAYFCTCVCMGLCMCAHVHVCVYVCVCIVHVCACVVKFVKTNTFYSKNLLVEQYTQSSVI